MSTKITDRPAAPPRDLPAVLPPESRETIGLVLLGAVLSLVGLVVWVIVRWGPFAWPVTLWGILVSWTFLLVGLWARLGPPPSAEEAPDSMRLMAVTLGGALGFFTAVLGLLMPFAMYPAE